MTGPMDMLSRIDAPTCWGVGFVAMDVVDGQDHRFAALGGSCGNVMAILAWLGWTAKPVARLGRDAAGDFIRRELRSLGVDVTSLTAEEHIRSPIVVQRFATSRDGTRAHRFSLTCPTCGRWLPRHRSVTITQSMRLVSGDAGPNVIYFDRVSPAALRLATTARTRGALVVFEPSSASACARFRRALDVCHVLKYSQERLGHLPDLAGAASPALIVETRGQAGLRYRWEDRWSQLDAYRVEEVIDAAGAGDWCTATLTHRMGRAGIDSFSGSTCVEIAAALQDGQAAAAVNCEFRGARGAMQALTLGEMNDRLLSLGEGKRKKDSLKCAAGPDLLESLIHFCEQCDTLVERRHPNDVDGRPVEISR